MVDLHISFLALVQFSTPDLPDNDGFYHIKMAYLMRTEGLKPAFPWLPLTILNQAEFSDHHFLYHAALIPFTFGDLRLGAKWSAVFFASLAFLSVWNLLKNAHIPYASLWALGLLAVSEAFIYRMSITRAQSLSLLVLMLGFDWLLRKKYLALGVLGFAYVWLYDGFPLLLILSLAVALSEWLIEKRLDLRLLMYIAGGIALGLVINPYFPQNIIFTVRHILPKLTDATAISVGNEWFPYDTAQLLQNSPLTLAAFMSGVLALGLSGKRMDTRTLAGFYPHRYFRMDAFPIATLHRILSALCSGFRCLRLDTGARWISNCPESEYSKKRRFPLAEKDLFFGPTARISAGHCGFSRRMVHF